MDEEIKNDEKSRNEQLFEMYRDGMPLRKLVAGMMLMNDHEEEEFYEQLEKSKSKSEGDKNE